MSDFDSNNKIPFIVETKGYHYEPECTEEELLLVETEQAKRKRGETSVESDGDLR